jgi:hypothetical protein
VLVRARHEVDAAADQRLQRARAAGEVEDLDVEPLGLEVALALGDRERQVVEQRLAADADRELGFSGAWAAAGETSTGTASASASAATPRRTNVMAPPRPPRSGGSKAILPGRGGHARERTRAGRRLVHAPVAAQPRRQRLDRHAQRVAELRLRAQRGAAAAVGVGERRHQLVSARRIALPPVSALAIA